MFKSLRLRPMTYESLHSKSCGGGLCFVRQRKKGMRALVLGGLLAVMCVCLLKADLIYIYIGSWPLSGFRNSCAVNDSPTSDNCIIHLQPEEEPLPQMRLTADRIVRRS
jgi:hypothetical protein